MLGWRLAVSAILIPSLIGLFALDYRCGSTAPVLLVLTLLLAVRSSWEFVDLLKTRSFQVSFPMVSACCVAVIVASWSPRFADRMPEALTSAMVVFCVTVLAVFLKGAIRYRTPGSSMETVAAEVLGVVYIGVLLTMTAQLRWVEDGAGGYLALSSLVIAAKCGDIGAYALGRLFGRKKMVPLLSPGKTWMGGLGAVLGAAIGSGCWLQFGPGLLDSDREPGSVAAAIGFGAVLGVVGLIGDLAESLIKRDVEKKDSAALMPGFGGLLDLLDSVLYAGPIAWILWQVLPLV